MSQAVPAIAVLLFLMRSPFAGAEPRDPAKASPPPSDEKAATTATAPDQPAVRDLGDGKYAVGKLIRLDRSNRRIILPASVNMVEGPLEFALVHQNGKIHESLLVTAARPFHLNVALKLLGFKESAELFPILDDDYRPTGRFHKVPAEIRSAARADIRVAWNDAGGTRRETALNKWIIYVPSGKPLPVIPWVYGGSYHHEGVFQAEAGGEFIALFTSQGSLFNYPGKDHDLDDVWIPATKSVPPVGTPVTVIIRPANSSPDQP